MRINPISRAAGPAVIEPPDVIPAAVAPTPTPAPAPVRSGLKKISFGNIATKKEETKTAYPIYRNPQATEIATRILKLQDEFDALEGRLKTDKAELKMLAAPFYFTTNHGRADIPSSINIPTDQGEVLVTYANPYPLLEDESGLVPILGETIDEYFRQSFELKIKGDKLPQDQTQTLMNRLEALFAEFGCLDALEVKSGLKPVDTFHAERHRLLCPEQNLDLEQVIPIIAMVKTKGRR